MSDEPLSCQDCGVEFDVNGRVWGVTKMSTYRPPRGPDGTRTVASRSHVCPTCLATFLETEGESFPWPRGRCR